MVVVAEVPGLTGADGMPAPCAGDPTTTYLRQPRLAQPVMLGIVAALLARASCLVLGSAMLEAASGPYRDQPAAAGFEAGPLSHRQRAVYTRRRIPEA